MALPGRWGTIDVSERARDGWTILNVRGAVDQLTASELSERLTRSVQLDEPHVVVDLRDVSFLDAVGLRALDRARRVAESHHGTVALVPSRQVRRVLDLTGLDGTFRIFLAPEDVTDYSGRST